MFLFNYNKNKLLIIDLIYVESIKRKSNIFNSFLPKSYWQKRGLYLLLKNPAVKYIRLPDNYNQDPLPKIKKQELQNCFNPIAIVKALEKEQPQWLDFYLKYEFGLNINDNPLNNSRVLEKIIKIQISKIKHGSNKSLINTFIAPLQISLNGLLKLPHLEDKIRSNIITTCNDFFDEYTVFKLVCLLEHHSILENKTFKSQSSQLLSDFNQVKQLIQKEFSESTILSILEHLKNLQNIFEKMLKYE